MMKLNLNKNKETPPKGPLMLFAQQVLLASGILAAILAILVSILVLVL